MYDVTDQRILWKGSRLPDPSAQTTSSMALTHEFEYFGPSADRTSVIRNGLLYPISGIFSGTYSISSSSGMLERIRCKDFALEFDHMSAPVVHGSCLYRAVGKGDAGDGKFLLQGTYNARTRKLHMARQYLCASDERAAMTISELKTRNIISFSVDTEDMPAAENGNINPCVIVDAPSIAHSLPSGPTSNEDSDPATVEIGQFEAGSMPTSITALNSTLPSSAYPTDVGCLYVPMTIFNNSISSAGFVESCSISETTQQSFIVSAEASVHSPS